MGEAVDGPELRAVEEGLGDEGEVVVLLRGVARPAEPSVKLAPCCLFPGYKLGRQVQESGRRGKVKDAM